MIGDPRARRFVHRFLLALIVAAIPPSRVGAQTPDSSAVGPVTLRIAFGSCVASPMSLIWEAISAKDPDIFLLLGDNVYQQEEHFGREPAILELYAKLTRAPGFDKLRRGGKLFAIWDDHDFGPDDADSGHPGKAASLAAFQKIWNQPAGPDDLRGSVAFKLVRRGVDIFMTDNRTYRWNPGKGGTPTMFGKRQLDWLRGQISGSKARAMIIASGGQLFSSRTRVDTLNGYPGDREILLDAIAKSPVGVIVLSGDRHYAEILEARAGKRIVLEATSSPLSAPRASAREVGVEANRRALYIGSDNFGLLTMRIGREISADVEIFDDRGRLLMARHGFAVK